MLVRICYCIVEDGHNNIHDYTVFHLSHDSWHGFLEYPSVQLEQAMWDGVGSHSRVKLHTKKSGCKDSSHPSPTRQCSAPEGPRASYKFAPKLSQGWDKTQGIYSM